MNLQTVNKAVLDGKRAPNFAQSNKGFYKYLINNNVAYYYSQLSGEKSSIEKLILVQGKRFNGKFEKTIKFVKHISDENKIPFLLFKTYKYIPEAVDGDIDLFLKEKDFHWFLSILAQEGFNCVENEPLKAVCTKDGYCILEPRVKSAFHGIQILGEAQIWRKVERVTVGGAVVNKTAKEIELLHLLLSVLYGPSYLKLYLYKIAKEEDFQRIRATATNLSTQKDLDFIERSFFTRDITAKKFPLFLSNSSFLFWWFRRIVPSNLSVKDKVKHLSFFLYSKYLYGIFEKLPFAHDWEIGNV